MQLLITVTADPTASKSPHARPVGTDIVDQLKAVAPRRRRDLGLDRAAAGRRRT